jgi:hypothetical protein
MYAGWKRRLWAPGLLLAVVLGWALLLWFSDKCDIAAIAREAHAGCTEYWFNRYQTLMAAIAALSAAGIAVAWDRRRLDRERADAADRQLGKYASKLIDVAFLHANITLMETAEQKQAAWGQLAETIDSEQFRQALIDPLMGEDTHALGGLQLCAKFGGLATAHGQNEFVFAKQAVQPLYLALQTSIRQRRAALQKGRRIEELYDLRLIDLTPFVPAFQEVNAPKG